MNLETTYLGSTLPNPLVASASPLSRTVDGVIRLADAWRGRDRPLTRSSRWARREAAANGWRPGALTASASRSRTPCRPPL